MLLSINSDIPVVADIDATATSKPRRKATLTDATLQALKPRDKPYKVTDGEGMYVVVSPSGTKAFRYDYRLNGNRETLTIGRYLPGTSSRSKGMHMATYTKLRSQITEFEIRRDLLMFSAIEAEGKDRSEINIDATTDSSH